ncbi:MAG: DUF86 domain-containing protein [Euryarchaeota archaeon]|nr:DUF86 domain-containing protein [Euryarchaeota archaeon]
MLDAIDKCASYTDGLAFARFCKEDMAVDAVLRNLEILGEAARNVPASARRRHPGVPWSLLVGLRDVVIHQYHGVDLENIWKIVREDLPAIRRPLRKALEEAKGN